MRRRRSLLASGLATATFLAGCAGDADEDGGNGGDSGNEGGSGENGGNREGNGEEETDPEEALEDDDAESTVDGLELVEHELVEDDFSVNVEGVVANNTGDELDYVEVGVVFYNVDGQRIGDSFTNTTDLPDGEEWVFEVMSTEDAEDIDDYSIAVTDSPF